MDADHIGSLLTPSVRSLGVYTAVLTERVRTELLAVLGKELSAMCTITHIHRGTVTVKVNNPSLAAQLHYETERLVTALNAALGEPLVHSISIRQGS